MLIVSMGCCTCAAVEQLTQHRQLKVVDHQHGYTAAFEPTLSIFEGFEHTKEVSES